jgi:hypothetical protein
MHGRVILFLLLSCASLTAAHFPSPVDWRDQSIYMIFTDRFSDGDPANNELTPGARFRPQNPRGIHGGDFKGIENHLDYIKNLGATAIWITPVFINDASSAWHGYGALDFSTISPQLGGLSGLRDLTKAAHARGIYIILDVVLNHLGAVATSDDPGWPRFAKKALATNCAGSIQIAFLLLPSIASIGFTTAARSATGTIPSNPSSANSIL